MRLQMAEFLQDTIEEIAITPKSKKPSKKLKDFADFVTKVRNYYFYRKSVKIATVEDFRIIHVIFPRAKYEPI